jgi:hypothetical protein
MARILLQNVTAVGSSFANVIVVQHFEDTLVIIVEGYLDHGSLQREISEDQVCNGYLVVALDMLRTTNKKILCKVSANQASGAV